MALLFGGFFLVSPHQVAQHAGVKNKRRNLRCIAALALAAWRLQFFSLCMIRAWQRIRGLPDANRQPPAAERAGMAGLLSRERNGDSQVAGGLHVLQVDARGR